MLLDFALVNLLDKVISRSFMIIQHDQIFSTLRGRQDLARPMTFIFRIGLELWMVLGSNVCVPKHDSSIGLFVLGYVS